VLQELESSGQASQLVMAGNPESWGISVKPHAMFAGSSSEPLPELTAMPPASEAPGSSEPGDGEMELGIGSNVSVVASPLPVLETSLVGSREPPAMAPASRAPASRAAATAMSSGSLAFLSGSPESKIEASVKGVSDPVGFAFSAWPQTPALQAKW
jgi:hypothetical protein